MERRFGRRNALPGGGVRQIGHTFQFRLSPGPRGRRGLYVYVYMYGGKKIMNFFIKNKNVYQKRL